MVTGAILVAGTTAQAQGGFRDLIKKGTNAISKNNTITPGGSFTNDEAVNALRQALQIGTQNASGRLNTVNGFFGNQLIKILMPPEAKKVESTLRSIGMGRQVDNAILAMNRAAEDAAGKAVPIFVSAITSMSVSDGISIVRGGNGAATNYLQRSTTQALTDAFRPVIQNSLAKVDATKYWGDVFSIYNKLPTTRSKVNTDLTAYVTERALNGMFVTIADEENKIRTNPASRVTDLLKKVFGGR
ncbi:MAG: DUF4197 domain-containing protein [Sphingobacteriales bacterium]|nr:MAG: DUF4197 domain-containing protein [Sphingobacteriales bacterium]